MMSFFLVAHHKSSSFMITGYHYLNPCLAVINIFPILATQGHGRIRQKLGLGLDALPENHHLKLLLSAMMQMLINAEIWVHKDHL